MFKKSIALLAILLQLAPAISVAALSAQDTAHFPQNNILGNPGFESGAAYWTAAGSSTITVTTTNVYRGTTAGVWTPTATNGTLTSAAMTYAATAGPNGLNGVASCRILNQSSIPGMVMQITDGTNVLGQVSVPSDPGAVSSYESTPPLYFQFPLITTGSKSLFLKITNTTGFGILKIDDCFVMTADSYNIGQIAQSYEVGAESITGCSGNWSVPGTSFATPSAASGSCVYTVSGQATAPGTNLPNITVPWQGLGVYTVIYSGTIVTGTVSDGIYTRFSDGTNPSREVGYYGTTGSSGSNYNGGPFTGSFLYTSQPSGTSVTFSLQGKLDGGSPGSIGSSASGGLASFRVLYTPSSSQRVLNSNTSPGNWSGSGNINGSTTSGSIADLGSLGGTITAAPGVQNISCASASGQLGITCTLPSAGSYLVCFSGSEVDTGTFFITSELTDASNNIIVGSMQGYSAVAGAPLPVTGCGNYNAPSTTATFKLRGAVNGGTGTITVATMNVISLNTPVAAPYALLLPNTYVAQITNNGTTATVLSQSGPGNNGVAGSAWITSCAVGGNIGQVHCTIATGIFSATGGCTVAYEGSGNDIIRLDAHTTATTFSTQTINTTPAVASGDFEVICTGPR